jgi:hypothetical protein
MADEPTPAKIKATVTPGVTPPPPDTVTIRVAHHTDLDQDGLPFAASSRASAEAGRKVARTVLPGESITVSRDVAIAMIKSGRVLVDTEDPEAQARILSGR